MGYTKRGLCAAVVLVPLLAFAAYRLESHHTVFNALLQRYVRLETVFTAKSSYATAIVQYKQLGEDQRWPEYCKRLLRVESTVVETASIEDRKAFWLNTYNATILYAVLTQYPLAAKPVTNSAYPTNSIQQIPKVWETQFPLSPGALSPNAIEAKLRALDDPRLFFAMHRASVDSPILFTSAYTVSRLDEQLERTCNNFIGTPENVRLDREKNQLQLSALFEWYLEDFNTALLETPAEVKVYPMEQRGLVVFLMKRMSKDDQRYIVEKVPRIVYTDFDWTLNDGQ